MYLLKYYIPPFLLQILFSRMKVIVIIYSILIIKKKFNLGKLNLKFIETETKIEQT